jgi:SAM-dependent methyltransferase
MENSSFLTKPKNSVLGRLFEAYEYLCAFTNPVWWVMDKNSKTVLDVGCGQGYPMRELKRMMDIDATGVDLFPAYLKEARKLKIYRKLIMSDVRKMSFADKSFDVVVSFQVIEHMTKKDGLQMMKNLERIARKQVIIATPLGYCDHPETDHNHLQKHLSGWLDEDFQKKGYDVHHQGLKLFFGNDGLVHKRIPSFLKSIIFIIDRLLMPVYFIFPSLSDYWIIASKTVSKK